MWCFIMQVDNQEVCACGWCQSAAVMQSLDIGTTSIQSPCKCVYAQYVSLGGGGEENTSYFFRLQKDLCLKQKGVK